MPIIVNYFFQHADVSKQLTSEKKSKEEVIEKEKVGMSHDIKAPFIPKEMAMFDTTYYNVYNFCGRPHN